MKVVKRESFYHLPIFKLLEFENIHCLPVICSNIT